MNHALPMVCLMHHQQLPDRLRVRRRQPIARAANVMHGQAGPMLGRYIAGSILMLHSAGPRVCGDVPILALVAHVMALLLSIRLVLAIARSGHP